MKTLPKITAIHLLYFCMFMFSTCGKRDVPADQTPQTEQPVESVNLQDKTPQTSGLPNLQSEILDKANTLTTSPIGNFDFKNFTYPFPRGWQDVGSKEFALESGKRPISNERIGITYLTTKYGDVTADGEDEAFVILKIDTGGGGIPHIVYVFSVKDTEPELIWYFRTGDKADGGLKKVWAEGATLAIELFGQDRFIQGEVETMRIDGDEEQLCCPTHFTRSFYKWNGSNFILQGKRETFSIKDDSAPPVENMTNNTEKEKGGTKK